VGVHPSTRPRRLARQQAVTIGLIISCCRPHASSSSSVSSWTSTWTRVSTELNSASQSSTYAWSPASSVADAFTAGLHAAFYASMGFMVLAAALSALRAGSSRV